MDLLITGATGFVGSHLAIRWLQRDPAARIACVVRAETLDAGLSRLQAAFHRAAANEGTALGDLMNRVDALPGELDDPAWIDHAAACIRGPANFIHCAANLSFREPDRAAVWRTNVDGTAFVLQALQRLPAITAFNDISTAYVAGDRQGDITEDCQLRPLHFNNPYEESKWAAESLVRQTCGVPWRIMRPSIVIGHSKTHRMSAQSGFYQVVDTLLQLGRRPQLANGPIRLPVTTGTTLDLIPIDVVVDEVLGLIAAGTSSANQVFHIVAADPLLLADVLRELTPLSGVAVEVNGPGTPLTPAAELVRRRLRYYMPYFAFARRFDRANTQAALQSEPCRIGVDALRAHVMSYLKQGARTLEAAA